MDTKGTDFFSLRGSVRSPSKFFPACVILSVAIVLASIPPPVAAQQDTRGLVFSRTGMSLTEAAGPKHSATYTVALATQPTASVTVSLSSGNEDAAIVSPATLTFTTGNWQDGQTVTVTAVDDNVQNDRYSNSVTPYFRQFPISHTARGGGYDSITGSVSVDVFDNDFNPTFSIADAEVTEGDSGEVDLNFTVTLSPTTVTKTGVKLKTVSRFATAGEDYTHVDKLLEFDAGDSSKTFTVKVKGDEKGEINETLTVTLYEVGRDPHPNRPLKNHDNNIRTGRATATGTIIDDDVIRSLVISPGSATLTEAAGTGHTKTYTVALTTRPTAEVTVNLSSKDDKAVIVSPASLVFTTENWSVGQTVTLTAVDDDIRNNVGGQARSTTIDHAAVGGDYDGKTGVVLISIEDDETTPSFSIADAQVIEGDSGEADLVFTVTLSPGAGFRTQVKMNTSDGTATAGEDYTSLANKIITFEPGDTSKTATVKVTGDEVDEANETLTATLSSDATGGIEFGRDTATGTITDDDDTPTVTLALSRSSISESDDSSTDSVHEHQTTVTATLNHLSSVPTTVTVSVEPQVPAKSSDYGISTNKVLTIAAGNTSSTGTVTITAVNNDIDTADKTVKVKGAASNTIGVNDPADLH